MRSPFQPGFKANQAEKDQKRREAEQLIRLRWAPGKPDPPRDVVAQESARGILLTWSRPVKHEPIIGYNVYKNTENELYTTIKNKGQRSIEVSAEAGASPPVVNLFVSCITAYGAESVKVQVQSAAKAEAGAPAPASPPPEYRDLDGGGGDTDDGGVGIRGGRGVLP